MDIHIRNSDHRPIYEQIKDQLKEKIISGVLSPGEKLPSIRLLAKELRISVITTKRAYDELEKEGFITSVQGKGSFVAGKNKDLIREEVLKKIEYHLQQSISLARSGGISLEELKEILMILEDNHV
ncbi:MAG: GntR family transcriptional regulator [Tissierellia bacterium]|nr:GntR family transcriptional regulator [Tissierellia bacterium]